MKKDLTGQKFGRLTVLEKSCLDSGRNGCKTYWICRCDCGNLTSVMTSNLTSGKVISCGCARNESTVNRFTKHNKRQTRLYHTWQDMKQRCFNMNDDAYSHYGGRGITVCDEWLEFEQFYDWAMTNGYRDDLTIDRKDVDGDYCPENCRWTTYKEQNRNRRSNRMITYGGKTMLLTEWAEALGVKESTLRQRLDKYGWNIADSLATPVNKKGRVNHDKRNCG